MLAAEDLGEAARIERKRDRFSHGWRGLADTQPPIVFGAVSGAHHHIGGAAQFVVEAGLHDLALDRRLAQLFRRPRAVKTPLGSASPSGTCRRSMSATASMAITLWRRT